MITTKAGLDPERFVSVVDGKKTALYVLKNNKGAEMCVCNYAGTIVSLMMPDRNGVFADVVLGMDSIDGLVNGPEPTLGAAIGRYGNRIAGAKFTLGGKEYQLAFNDGPNSLHGGPKGFHKVVWDAEQINDQTLVLRYTSADGEEGFPGTLKVEMCYKLTDDNEVRLDYKATTDKLTLCNLTNHSYFNLAGIEKVTSSVEGQMLTVNADRYLPIDKVSIPFGEKAPVEGTPFDFRTPHLVGERINDDNEQLRNGSGYDHSFAINQDKPGELCLATVFEDLKSGRVMKTYTTEPGIQVYTGNFLTGFEDKHGCAFPRRSGICFESQHHPDSPNKPQFEQATLAPGEVYHQLTIYAFSTK
ncbi:MAG: galactose mutarotase [Bacteroidales bacterium]|nr:galactose mutarotase [Bacteroidales bacterium]